MEILILRLLYVIKVIFKNATSANLLACQVLNWSATKLIKVSEPVADQIPYDKSIAFEC